MTRGVATSPQNKGLILWSAAARIRCKKWPDQPERRCSGIESAARTELGITCVVAEKYSVFSIICFPKFILYQ
jgi:hypothetical protein